MKREIKKISRNKWQWEQNNSKPMGCSKSSSKREVYSNTILPKETRKTSNRQLYFTPKAIGKRRTTTTKKKISRREEIIKIWEEINVKEMKDTIVKVNKTISCFFEKINQNWQIFRQIHQEKKRNQINKIRNEKERLQQTMQKYNDYKRLL